MTFNASNIILSLCLLCGAAWAFERWAPAGLAPRDEGKLAGALGMLPQLFIPLFLVCILRVGFAEPFRIPSGSMNPGLVDGDFILVDKRVWGLRAPFTDKVILEGRAPLRGEVAVFRFPKDPAVDFIKRVIALPGDKVEYKGKKVAINGAWASYANIKAMPGSAGADPIIEADESLPGEIGSHRIAFDPGRALAFPIASMQGCQAGSEPDSFTCLVPQGSLLAMGDNRDNSMDSRYWGLLPDSNLIGRAFFIWMSLEGPSRIGSIR